MTQAFNFLAAHPALLLFLFIGIGALVGHITIKKVSLGSAAVLFIAIIVSAIASYFDVTLAIPAEVGHLGLALFTFTIGVSSGKTFFRTMKTSGLVVLGVCLALICGGGIAVGLGPLLGLDSFEAIGVFAGSLTNTPALAAAGNHPEATVGYSIAYIFGVIGMLLVQNLALRHASDDTQDDSRLARIDIRIDHIATNRTAQEVEKQYGNELRITRFRRGEESPIELVTPGLVLKVDDVITVVGKPATVERAVVGLGHKSSHHLNYDRSKLDSRRLTVSDESLAGRTIASLGIEDKYDATVSRIRRGDTHIVAHPGVQVELGDSLLVVAPRNRMNAIRDFLGDSTRGLTTINPAAIGVGVALGFVLGAIPLPLPGGGSFVLGSALCSLMVGLVFGKVGHIGSFSLTLPFTVIAVISDLGLLMFLAQAGTTAGAQILQAFSSGAWLNMLGLGVIITLSVGLINYFVQRHICKMGGSQISGLLAGSQTQPALLAYANSRTRYNPKVSLGYSMAYPVAMIMKILVASGMTILAG